MIEIYKPKISDLWFREQMLSDEETMEYNKKWGGTIPFPKEKWQTWYNKWVDCLDNERYYRYLIDTENQEFVGEIAYHFDDIFKRYLCDVIIHAKYRNRGFGSAGIRLLCNAAKDNGIDILYDNISKDNKSYLLFLKNGFEIDCEDENIVLVKRVL